VKTRAFLAPGHGREGSDGKDGVEVPEEQDARRAARGGEIDLQRGAEAGELVETRVRIEESEGENTYSLFKKIISIVFNELLRHHGIN